MNALAVRRRLIVAPVAAGMLAIVGVIADPAPRAEGRELVEAYAADPDALNFKSLGYQFAYTARLPRAAVAAWRAAQLPWWGPYR